MIPNGMLPTYSLRACLVSWEAAGGGGGGIAPPVVIPRVGSCPAATQYVY